MKKAAAVLLACVLLAGCSGPQSDVERGMALRTKILSSQSCSFDADITADYGDKIYTFSVNCQADPGGEVRFSVTQPQSIAGITGTISQGAGNFTFDDKLVAFPLLADEMLSPISAPWIFFKTLCGGCLTSAGREENCLRLSLDDSFREDALRLDIWVDDRERPVRCEILHRGRRILSLDVSNFEIL